MSRDTRYLPWIAFSASLLLFSTRDSGAATPGVEQALNLAPVQSDVDYERPTKQQAGKCTIKDEIRRGRTGWVVRGETGQLLRRFIDTNGDKNVDLWCYFKNGVEVYRDIDANFNRKADQYRWLGTAGVRWGLDRNEDGQIDRWKTISAEEATAELVAALRTGDANRFGRLLLTSTELRSLGLGPAKMKLLREKIASARKSFKRFASNQRLVGGKSQWVNFGASQPGIVPVGTDGSTKDVTVYENVIAMIETSGKHDQIHVGTVIRAGDAWRLADLPTILSNDRVTSTGSGIFFQPSLSPRDTATRQSVASQLSEKVQKLVNQLDKLDTALNEATSTGEQGKLHTRRAALLRQLADGATSEEDRASWVRQLIDTVSAAVQSGAYPDGIKQINALFQELNKSKSKNTELIAYVRFREMTATYGQSLQEPKADFAQIQEDWLKQLKQFVGDYPHSPDAAEAILQLAIAQEFAGNEQDAKKWYGKITRDFPDTLLAKKARGATTRLDSVGKPIRLRGKSVFGKPIDLAAYRGKTLLVHYWATWCKPCKTDLAVLKRINATYSKRGFAMVGVSLDNDRQTLVDYLRKNRLAWPQLFETGGLDSRLANELGILALPTMILLDTQGRVVNRSIHVGELDAELDKRLK